MLIDRIVWRSRLFAAIVAFAPALAIARDTAGPTPRTARNWFAKRPAGDPIRFLDGAPDSRKVRLADITRNAVRAEGGGSLTTSIARGDSLEIAMAAICLPPGAPCPGTTTFTVTAEVDGEPPHTLHTETLAESDAARWHIRRLDLDALADGPARLRFAATGVSRGARSGAERIVLWGEPQLMRVSEEPGPNVILISIDTLRADHLGCYGYERDTSPNLDQLAQSGIRFARAISQSPWTTPSHASLFTSLHPSSHKVNVPLSVIRDGNGALRLLSRDTITLAEILRRQGFATSAVTGGGTISGVWGFDRGFDHFAEVGGGAKNTEDELNAARGGGYEAYWDAVLQRLSALENSRFFLFLHTFEVHDYEHTLYARPMMTAEQFAGLAGALAPRKNRDLKAGIAEYLKKTGLMRKEITCALYDGGIRFVDENLIGALVDELKRRGLYERTILVVTSDHGEEFGEHDPTRILQAHGSNLYDPLLHVPLLVRVPGRFQPGLEIGDQVRSIDIAPTVLDLLQIQPPPAMEGRSLVPLMSGERDSKPVPAISEATATGPEWKSLRTPTHKFVYLITSTGSSAWWEVDLGQSREIDSIRVWNRTDCCRERLSQYWVLVSENPQPQPGDAAITAHFEFFQADSPTRIQVGAKGRYVRISKEGAGLISLAELEVIEADSSENVALGRLATQSSLDGEGAAARAVDGNTDGNYNNGSVTHTLTQSNESPTEYVDRTGISKPPTYEILFDLSGDRAEQSNVVEQQAATADELSQSLRRQLDAMASKNVRVSPPPRVDDAVIERLRALGYVE